MIASTKTNKNTSLDDNREALPPCTSHYSEHSVISKVSIDDSIDRVCVIKRKLRTTFVVTDWRNNYCRVYIF